MNFICEALNIVRLPGVSIQTSGNCNLCLVKMSPKKVNLKRVLTLKIRDVHNIFTKLFDYLGNVISDKLSRDESVSKILDNMHVQGFFQGQFWLYFS